MLLAILIHMKIVCQNILEEKKVIRENVKILVKFHKNNSIGTTEIAKFQLSNQFRNFLATSRLSKYSFYRTESMATLVTNSFTNCGLVNLIEVALASEDANSKLVEVGTVADIDAKKCVDGSWVRIFW